MSSQVAVSPDLANRIQGLIDAINTTRNAEIRQSSDERPRMALKLSFPLDVAATKQNPYLISQPFDGFFVEQASDAATNVQMAIGALDDYATMNSVGLFANSSGTFSRVVKQASLTWAAQPNKVMTIVFFLGLDYRPGSYAISFGGTVTVNNGASVQVGSLGAGGIAGNVSVTSASQIALCPVNTNRSEIVFCTDQDIWIGGTGVLVNNGTLIKAGERFSWANTASLFAIAAGATATVSGMEELVV